MSETLKPCPLCGSTDIVCFAEECGDGYDNVPIFRAVVGCRGCHEEGCDSTYDDEPCFGIEAYYRADHPLIRDEEDPEDCERVLERHMAERWNRRAERTCRNVCEWNIDTFHFTCSECGAEIDGDDWGDSPVFVDDYHEHLRYCPNCGARVEP